MEISQTLITIAMIVAGCVYAVIAYRAAVWYMTDGDMNELEASGAGLFWPVALPCTLLQACIRRSAEKVMNRRVDQMLAAKHSTSA